jgi:hypothetical protein
MRRPHLIALATMAALGLAATSAFTAGPASPQDDGRYGLRDLRGTYGFSASGTIVPPA